MPKHLETLLTSAGLPAEDVAQILAVPEAEQETFDVKPFAEKVRSNYQTQLQNDPAFFSELTLEKLPPEIKKTLESGQYARMTNVAKEKIAKSLGFTAEEIKDLQTDDYKALDFYIPAILEKWTKNKSGDKETQAQLIEARKKLEQFGPDYEESIRSKFETESNQKINQTLLRANLISELSGIEGLKIPASDLAKTAEDILLSKYGYERVGDFSIELRQKANPTMKVLKDDSSQELSLREALQQLATERNWISEEKKDDKGSGKIEVKPGKDGSLKMHVAPHVAEKIRNKIQAEA